ncbi:MAG: TIGR00341 family protein [Melioribacteraceae bacterium]
MMTKIFALFDLRHQTEKPEDVIERIKKDSVFKGTNIWILVFAIFIASLGLNVNSTAVIIGAMLISPLMGPIIGIGMGVAINDLHFAKEAVKHFTFAIVVGLITSTLYFSITPLNDAYSELLSRTTPTIYDVLIALFGGLAGIIANTSNQKGNVIPGVAIATALMPPLCTAGYGLATMQFSFFFGAFYLFTINTVFIALATFITLKFMKYPIKHLKNPIANKRSLRIIYGITLLTLIPSIYFGYEMIRQNRFTRTANLFVESHSSFQGSYLLNKEINPQSRSIKLIYGGANLEKDQIDFLQRQLKIFGIENTTLTIKQGFAFLADKKESDRTNRLSKLIEAKEQQLLKQKQILDSLFTNKEEANKMLTELRILFPDISSLIINPTTVSLDSTYKKKQIVLIKSTGVINKSKYSLLEKWIKVRLNNPELVVSTFR